MRRGGGLEADVENTGLALRAGNPFSRQASCSRGFAFFCVSDILLGKVRPSRADLSGGVWVYPSKLAQLFAVHFQVAVAEGGICARVHAENAAGLLKLHAADDGGNGAEGNVGCGKFFAFLHAENPLFPKKTAGVWSWWWESNPRPAHYE